MFRKPVNKQICYKWLDVADKRVILLGNCYSEHKVVWERIPKKNSFREDRKAG